MNYELRRTLRSQKKLKTTRYFYIPDAKAARYTTTTVCRLTIYCAQQKKRYGTYPAKSSHSLDVTTAAGPRCCWTGWRGMEGVRSSSKSTLLAGWPVGLAGAAGTTLVWPRELMGAGWAGGASAEALGGGMVTREPPGGGGSKTGEAPTWPLGLALTGPPTASPGSFVWN